MLFSDCGLGLPYPRGEGRGGERRGEEGRGGERRGEEGRGGERRGEEGSKISHRLQTINKETSYL